MRTSGERGIPIEAAFARSKIVSRSTPELLLRWSLDTLPEAVQTRPFTGRRNRSKWETTPPSRNRIRIARRSMKHKML